MAVPPSTTPVEPVETNPTTPTAANPHAGRYYFEGGFRRVKPYYHTYNTYCKERWRGRTLLDIFTSEFRDRTPEYYVCPQSLHISKVGSANIGGVEIRNKPLKMVLSSSPEKSPV